MQQSFKNRLASLERLEAQAERIANPGPLTNDDCARVLEQMAMSNVILRDGRALRQWDVGSDGTGQAIVDLALLRLNIELAHTQDGPDTTPDLAAALAQYVADEDMPSWFWGLLWQKGLLSDEPL